MSAKSSNISLVVEDVAWKQREIELARIRSAAQLTLSQGLKLAARHGPPPALRATCPERGRRRESEVQHDGGGVPSELTILLTNDERLRELNARFRGKDSPTNVLSFPASAEVDDYLGDVAIALGTAEREASTAGTSLMAHTLHLTVHGVLHLLGYDHVLEREARIMERLEIAILGELEIPNPYARAGAAV